MIREGVFPRLEEHSQQELPYRCNHGKVFYKGKEYSCVSKLLYVAKFYKCLVRYLILFENQLLAG